MYSLLIVDDEQIVLKAVSHVVSQSHPDIIIAGQARSGAEAISIALDKKPDIVFMDIELYGMDGLEAIREMKSITPDAVFIIISAYDNFSYAKRSIELGVMDYLLKPVSKDDISKTLRKAVARIEHQRREKRTELELREKIHRMLPLIEEDFFIFLLYPGFVSRTLEEYQELMDWHYAYGQAALMHIETGQPGGEKEAEFRQVIRRYLPKSANVLIGPRIGRTFPLMVGFDGTALDLNVWRDVHGKLEGALGTRACVILGKVYPGLNGVVRSYRELRQIAYLNQYPRGVHRAESSAIRHSEGRFDTPWEQEQKLFAAVQSGNVQLAGIELKRLYDKVVQSSSRSLEAHKDYFHEIVAVLLRILYEFVPEEDFRAMDSDIYRGKLEDAGDQQALLVALTEIISSMARTVQTVETHDYHPVIKKARDYIDSNYHKNITLLDISNAAAVSPSYLSKLFRENLSETVMDYLTRMRVEKALDLLAKTDLSVREIAWKVGYADPNYFCKVFKKITNLTPTAVRRQQDREVQA